MTEPFLGEIQLFGFNFPPRGWAFCTGATVAVQQNSALYALIGTLYGGNGTTTFQLPNFVNRAGCNQGAGPGTTRRAAGDTFGESSVTLTAAEMPAHIHQFTIYNQGTTSKLAPSPSAGNSLALPGQSTPFVKTTTANAQFSPNMIGMAGSSQPHENRQPYIALNYCIAMAGVFPAFG
ncbi:phage tail protein [Mesorhizobium sp. NPDC059025]|uniref:phage tail protein n=1 Tax=unclassified Mesorhizobium TaxID=325217 RepID=UPI0036C995E9